MCALLGVTLIGASGRADDAAPSPTLPELAMAVESRPSPRPAPEMLITAAPVKVDPAAPPKASAPAAPKPAIARPRVMMMEVTAYCACKKCCGPKAQGITASGKRVSYNDGLFVAADKNVFDFYTRLKIPGYANGQPVPVLDRGGAIKGNKLDVYFSSHQRALEWGRQTLAVTVVD